MSKIHLELLDEARQQIFHKLSLFSQYGYLAGGTALALQINHRKSFDFDVFVNSEIGNTLRVKIKEIFNPVSFLINSNDQITFTLGNSELTFLWYYFKPLYPLIKTNSIPLSSILDIAIDKAQTLGRRAVWRDYVDLYVLLKDHGLTLEQVVKDAKNKFGAEFAPEQFLEQLVYFKDVKTVPIEWTSNAYSVQEIQSYLKQKLDQYLAETI